MNKSFADKRDGGMGEWGMEADFMFYGHGSVIHIKILTDNKEASRLYAELLLCV